MSLTKAVFGNTAVQVSGKMLGTILGILTVAVLTRHLGREGYGEFTTVTSFLQFFGILVDFGLTLTALRLLAEPGADRPRVASNIFTLRLVSGVLFFGAAAALGFAFPYSREVRLGIAVTSLSFLCISLSSITTAAFQQSLRVAWATAAEVAGRLALLVGVILAARAGGGLIPILAILSASNLLQLALSLVFLRRIVPIRLAYDRALWRRVVRESWPVGVSIAFNFVYLKGDVVILSLVRSQAEVGLYGAAYKVLDVVTVIPTVFMGIAMPALAAAWSSSDAETFKRRLGRAFAFMSAIAVPISVGTLGVSHDLMALLAGREFADSGALLSVLMVAGSLVFWSALFGHAVVAMGLQKKMIWAYGIDAALSLLLYIILIPRFGAAGAAWVTVFSEGLIAVLTAAFVIKSAKAAVPLKPLGLSLASSLVMLGAILVMPGLNVLMRIAAGIVVYAACMLISGGVRRDDLAALGLTRARH
jgi:O-antigen/teichoic acid export membrane protein